MLLIISIKDNNKKFIIIYPKSYKKMVKDLLYYIEKRNIRQGSKTNNN